MEPSITKKIIVTSNNFETRVALLENGHPIEYFSEKKSERSILTNVYMGLVSRILPGMNSAFIDIGEEKSGFLFGGDVIDPDSSRSKSLDIDNNTDYSKNTTPIENILNQGQPILCQVIKEPLGTKGPRISMGPKIPGRFLVLMPDNIHIGISRRIENEDERLRLTNLIRGFIEKHGHGIIVRTAATEASDDEIQNDLNYLLSTWKSVKKKISMTAAPGVIYTDVPIELKIIRDLFASDIEEIICDNSEDYHKLQDFFDVSIPGAKQTLRLYEEKIPIFDVFNIEKHISQALSKKASLPSGGFLIIEQTEALTTIDVNTGSYTGKQSQRDTILKTNLEAIPVIVHQLRLRNIGGIIIIDFIDMDELDDREIIFNEITNEFKKDRARTNILKMSELGLIEMTRKRTAESLQRRLLKKCPTCQGLGQIKNPEFELLSMFREIARIYHQNKVKSFTLTIRDDLRSIIDGNLSEIFVGLISDLGISVNIKPAKILHADFKTKAWSIESTSK